MSRRLRFALPSPAMVVALIALIVAVGGTAYANGFGPFSGNKIIKKGSLSGNRLQNHTLTGTQINVSKLGTVPNATTAVNASTAANANALGGQPAAAYGSASKLIDTGIIKVSGTPAGATGVVLKQGPFEFTLDCVKTAGGAVTGTLDVTSTEANSVLLGYLTPAGTPHQIDSECPETPPAYSVTENTPVAVEAPDGSSVVADFANGVNSLGTDCWAQIDGWH